MDGKYRGRVVQFDELRHFGFIDAEQMLPFGEAKIFVHQSNCADTLSLGVYVTFEIGNAYKLNRRPQAVRVTIVQAPTNEHAGEVVTENGAKSTAVIL